MKTLKHYQFLRILNLSGNPVCEEPDYRVQVILKLPQVVSKGRNLDFQRLVHLPQTAIFLCFLSIVSAVTPA